MASSTRFVRTNRMGGNANITTKANHAVPSPPDTWLIEPSHAIARITARITKITNPPSAKLNRSESNTNATAPPGVHHFFLTSQNTSATITPTKKNRGIANKIHSLVILDISDQDRSDSNCSSFR